MTLPEGAVALERLVAHRRRLGLALLTLEGYDRWGAKTSEDHARAAAEARPLEAELAAVTEALGSRVRAMRRERAGAAAVRAWALAHVELLDAFLAGLGEEQRTERHVALEAREAWERVAAGRRDLVDENEFFIRHDPARYRALFGFPPTADDAP